MQGSAAVDGENAGRASPVVRDYTVQIASQRAVRERRPLRRDVEHARQAMRCDVSQCFASEAGRPALQGARTNLSATRLIVHRATLVLEPRRERSACIARQPQAAAPAREPCQARLSALVFQRDSVRRLEL